MYRLAFGMSSFQIWTQASPVLSESSGFQIVSLWVIMPCSLVGVTNLSEEDIPLIFRVRLHHRKSHITRNKVISITR